MFERLRAAESICRPLGDDRFLARIERLTKRRLRAGKRGPKLKAAVDGEQGELLNALSP
jgi:REP-associated tyrosine transposase